MFSGIVESVKPLLSSRELVQAHQIQIEKPSEFNDLKIGDSIACDGVCLTLEAFDNSKMTFTLAAETLKVLNWNPEHWSGKKINLERSLKMGDRIHGHLVTGHVDSLGKVVRADQAGDSFFLGVEVAHTVLPFIWKKGSITLNGVSLTVNAVDGSYVEACLIPETLKRTNLGELVVGNTVNVEPDYLARAVTRSLELKNNGYLHTEGRGS